MSWLTDLLRLFRRPPSVQHWQLGVSITPLTATATITTNGRSLSSAPGVGHRLFLFETPPHRPRAAGVLTVEATGYLPQTIQIEIGPPNRELPAVDLVREVPVRRHRHESGALVPENRYLLRREDGSLFDYRGASVFLALHRQIAGESPARTLAWLKSFGANVARVFPAGVPWSVSHIPTVDPWLYTRPDFQQQIANLLDAYAAEGIFVQLSVITEDTLPVEEWERILNLVYEAAQGHWNALVEDCNEPWVGGKRAILDAIIARGRVNRRGVLSAYGIQPDPNPTPPPEVYLPCPFLGFGTAHLDRSMDRFPRNGKELKEMSDANRCYWVSDEPRGVAEFQRDGNGARTNNLRAVVGHFATARLFGGATLHTQCGLEGRAPNGDEPRTEEIAQAVGDVWEAIPAEAITGEYCAPHQNNFPLLFAPTDGTLPANRPYGRRVGDQLWAVTPMTRDDWEPHATDGWTIVRSSCHNTVHELRR